MMSCCINPLVYAATIPAFKEHVKRLVSLNFSSQLQDTRTAALDITECKTLDRNTLRTNRRTAALDLTECRTLDRKKDTHLTPSDKKATWI